MKQISTTLISYRRCDVVVVVCRMWILLFTCGCMLLSSSLCIATAITTTDQQQQQQQQQQQNQRQMSEYISPIVYNVPYALAFFFENESLPSSTCIEEMNIVQNATYLIYKEDIKTDSMINTADISMLEQYSMSSMDSIGTSTGGGYSTDGYVSTSNNEIRKKKRQLIRGSRQHSILSLLEDDHEHHHRQLQSWCYALCSTHPRLWLILHGCKTECRLRRRMHQDEVENNVDNNDVVNNIDIHHRNIQSLSMDATFISTLMNDNYYTEMGTSTQLLYGQGDLSASTFYSKVRLLIPTSNPCRVLLLTMKYRRIPLVVNI